MMTIFKQSEESDINSSADTFGRAVMRLTIYYTAGVAVILCIFSVLVFSLFSADIIDQIDEDRQSDESLLELTHEPFLHEVTENLFNILVFSDLILLTLTVFVSYFLARKTLAPLKDAHERQERFVADAAHELRTPLSVLKAGSELVLGRKRTPEEYVTFITEGKEEIDRLIVLANDLLLLSQYTKQGDMGTYTEFSLSHVCEKQCAYVLPYAQSKNVSVTTDIMPQVSMMGDSDALSRLVLNLLKNAIDYNVQQGTVALSLSIVDAKIILTVRDTGIGIAPEDTTRIFERFTKTDLSRTQTVSSGSGLGLALVQEIVHAHQGVVSVESTVGKGSIFTVVFPCA